MDKAIELELQEDPAQEVVEELIHRLVESNGRVATPSNHQRLAVFAKKNQEMVGGAYGYTHWGWLFVSHLWVDESHRHNGIGSALMRRVEEAAVARGAKFAHLDTYDFQALGFYEKIGYRTFGRLEDYPPGHTRYFLTKQLETSIPRG